MSSYRNYTPPSLPPSLSTNIIRHANLMPIMCITSWKHTGSGCTTRHTHNIHVVGLMPQWHRASRRGPQAHCSCAPCLQLQSLQKTLFCIFLCCSGGLIFFIDCCHSISFRKKNQTTGACYVFTSAFMGNILGN